MFGWKPWSIFFLGSLSEYVKSSYFSCVCYTNRIILYYRNQMHKNYQLDDQMVTNIIHKDIKLTEL